MRLEEIARIDLNRLAVLAILLEEGGVSRAARRLGRTQSAVSHTLAELRRDLGDELLVRVGTGVVPTPFALAIQEDLRVALERLGAVTQRDAFDPQTSVRTFRIGWSDYLQMVIGLPWLSTLRESAPHIHLETYPSPPDGPGAQLAEGVFDLSFDVGLEDMGDLRSRLLLEDELVSFVGAKVPLTGLLDLGTFLAAPHVMVAPQGRPGGPVDRALATLGLHRKIAIRLSHFMGVVELVRESPMIITLPRRLLEALGAPTDRLHPTPLTLPPLRIRTIWHSRVHNDPGVAWLRQSLIHATRSGFLSREPIE